MSVNTITIPRWFDRHLHIRKGEMLKNVFPCTLKQHATGAVIMGNHDYPDEISTITKAVAYREEIESCIPSGYDFKPRMTLYLTDNITPGEVVRGFEEDAWCAVKMYLTAQGGIGGTTGSSSAVKDLKGRYPVFEAMEKKGIPLLGHFEAVEKDIDEFDREIVSVERDLQPIMKSFPSLPIVFEHVTDGRAADFITDASNNIQATVTAHHLLINRNAMFWGGMNSGHYCKPVPKREWHRQRIRWHITKGPKRERYGAGTDSAPHDEEVKSRCYGCKAGIFTAPRAVEMYVTAFEEENALEHVGQFLSENFLSLYGMKVSSEMMTIERSPREVPEKVGNVQVFLGGTTLSWKVV